MVIGTSILTGVGLSIMAVAFPEIRAAFPDASDAQLSWINNLFTIVSAATLIPFGVLADRYGRKRLLLFGVLLFTIGSVIGALAPSPEWIMVGRTVQALGSSAYGPASTALLISAFKIHGMQPGPLLFEQQIRTRVSERLLSQRAGSPERRCTTITYAERTSDVELVLLPLSWRGRPLFVDGLPLTKAAPEAAPWPRP